MKISLIIKRLIDLFGSFIIILVLSPALLLVSIIVRLNSPGPALFVQERAGRNGNTFKIFKFRTMAVNSVDDNKGIERNDPRITTIGHFLRKWSIDELPQLFNVFLGNMSLVGPRPLLLEYVQRYNERQKQRLSMKPGITGLQQIEARYDTKWEEKFEYDIEYIQNFSVWLDIKILFRTIKSVLILPDSSESGGKTSEFK